MKYYNIIVIVIDALRAKNLGCYGYSKKTSPNIDKLAKNGILFENAFSCFNATDPSITTILTGMYPVVHSIRNHGGKITERMIKDFYKLNLKPLPEILLNAGYTTFGLDWIGKWHKKGFEYYLADIKDYSKVFKCLKFFKKIYRTKIKKQIAAPVYTATELTDASIELVNKVNDKPFFLFIHYWDTHTPYYSPNNIYKQFIKIYNYNINKKLKYLTTNIKNEEWKEYLIRCFGKHASVGEAIAKYDASIRYVDQEIGRLIDYLKDKGVYEDTIFIITSDHGESLTEHNILFDHHGLYDVSIHVPLIFSNLPFEVEQKYVDDFVQHVDIVPTVLDILNIKFREYKFDGISLVQLMKENNNLTRSYIVVEEAYTERKLAIRTKEWKYIYSPSKNDATCRYCGVIHGGVEELYNLKYDPNEMNNIFENNSEMAEMLRKELFKFLNNLKKKKEKMLLRRIINNLMIN